MLKFICVSNPLLSACRLGTSHMVTAWRRKRRVSTEDLKSAVVQSAVVKLKCLLAALPKSMEKHIQRGNICKKGFQILAVESSS